MDTQSAPVRESFGKSMAKLFVHTTVSSAGVYAGLGIVLVAAGHLLELKKRRETKNSIEN